MRRYGRSRPRRHLPWKVPPSPHRPLQGRVPGKNWCNARQHMVSGLFDVVGNHVFKRQHALDVQITCSSDQILLVCILTGYIRSDGSGCTDIYLPPDRILPYASPSALPGRSRRASPSASDPGRYSPLPRRTVPGCPDRCNARTTRSSFSSSVKSGSV